MKEFSINYDVFMEQSMRNIIKLAVREVAKNSDINFSFEFEIEAENKKNNCYLKVFRINNINTKNLVVKNSYFTFNTIINDKVENIKILFNSILRFSDNIAGFEINFGVQNDDIENDVYFDNGIFSDIFIETFEEKNYNNVIPFETLKKIK